jgi:hypothetical protein
MGLVGSFPSSLEYRMKSLEEGMAGRRVEEK